MGLGTQMIAWQEDFCEQLAGRGFHVIRFDNRDVGRSTSLDHVRPPTRGEILRRRPRRPRYTLSDMAGDAAGLLDGLGIERRARGGRLDGRHDRPDARGRAPRPRALPGVDHVHHRQRVRRPARRCASIPSCCARRRASARPTSTRWSCSSARSAAPASTGDADDLRTLARAELRARSEPPGSERQIAAILASGDRTRRPATDQGADAGHPREADRLVRPSGGRATAKAITGARLELIDGMGHDLPREVWPRIIDGIVANAARAAHRMPAAAG